MDERVADNGKLSDVVWLRYDDLEVLSNNWWWLLQVKTKQKAEIQALSSFGFQYITEEYLPRKLKEGDWI